MGSPAPCLAAYSDSPRPRARRPGCRRRKRREIGFYFLLTISAEQPVGEAELAGSCVNVAAAVAWEEFLLTSCLRSLRPVVLEVASSEQPARPLECVRHRPEDVPDRVEELAVGELRQHDGHHGDGEDETCVGVETHGGGVRGQLRLLCLEVSVPHSRRSRRAGARECERPQRTTNCCFTKSSSAMAACPEAAEKMVLHLHKTHHPLTTTHSLAWNAEKRIFPNVLMSRGCRPDCLLVTFTSLKKPHSHTQQHNTETQHSNTTQKHNKLRYCSFKL